MKCPLLKSKQINYGGEFGRGEREYFLNCIRGECAWYNIKYGECSVKMATCFLNFIRLDTQLMSTRRTTRESSFKEQCYRDI